MSVSHEQLRIEITSLRVMTEGELKHVNTRLEKLESGQASLLTVATQGRTGLRIVLWIGGFMAGGLALVASFWDRVFK